MFVPRGSADVTGRIQRELVLILGMPGPTILMSGCKRRAVRTRAVSPDARLAIDESWRYTPRRLWTPSPNDSANGFSSLGLPFFLAALGLRR